MKIKVNHICVFVFWAISRPFSERSQNKSFIISLFVLLSVSNDAMRLPLRLNWIFLMFFNLIFVKICFHHSFMFLPTSLCRRQNGNWTLRFSLRFETLGFAYPNNDKKESLCHHKVPRKTLKLQRWMRQFISRQYIKVFLAFHASIAKNLCHWSDKKLKMFANGNSQFEFQIHRSF